MVLNALLPKSDRKSNFFGTTFASCAFTYSPVQSKPKS